MHTILRIDRKTTWRKRIYQYSRHKIHISNHYLNVSYGQNIAAFFEYDFFSGKHHIVANDINENRYITRV